MNIDFSQFKKIQCDDKCTTLQHPSGHNLKIALSGLSPKMKEELEALPLHKAKGGIMPATESHPRGSKPSKSSTTMPGSPANTEKAYTEPDDGGTDIVIKALNRQAPPLGPKGAADYHSPPCINPSCKSYGKPHPNCRCYGGKMGMHGGYAEGGKVENFCSSNRAHDTNCQYFPYGGPVQGEAPGVDPTQQPPPPVQDYTEGMGGPAAAMNTNASPQQPVTPSPMPAAPEVTSQPESTSGQELPAPQVGQQPETVQPIPDQPIKPRHVEHADMLHEEVARYEKELNNGQITPRTYHDLFMRDSAGNERGPLAKIGTIFGMLIGGAGAGLSGQPNAILHMMDKEIENDLERQKASAEGSRNFMTMAQQALENDAKVTGLNLANEDNRRALAYGWEARTILHEQVKKAQAYPEGSKARMDAMKALQILSQGVQAKEMDMFSRAGLAQAAREVSEGGAQGLGQSKGPVNLDKLNQLERNNQMKIPGAPSEANISRMHDEAKHLQQVEALRTDFKNAYQTLDKEFALAGRISPNARAAIIKTLAAKAAPVVGVGHADDLIESMMPQATDWGKDTKHAKQKSNDQYFDVLAAGTPTLEQFGVKNKPQSQGSSKEQIKVVNGIKYKRGPNGEAIEVK